MTVAGRVRQVGRVLTAGVAALVVSGCSTLGDVDVLQVAGEDVGEFGSAVPDVPGDHSFTVAAIPLCVSADESATITEISPVDGKNLEVVDFATTTDVAQQFGDGPVDLRGAGFDPASRTVSAPCPAQHEELALELRRGPTAAGTGEGFVVRYETASGAGEMTIPFLVRLCPGEVVGYGCAPS